MPIVIYLDRISTKVFWIITLTMMFVGSNSVAAIQEATTEGQQEVNGEIEIILRLSKDLIDALTRDKIEMTFPVDKEVQGIKSSGSVYAEGVPQIVFQNADNHAEFEIRVSGTAYANFHADAGPAVAGTTSTTKFLARKSFYFDGKRFTQGPVESSVTSKTCVKQICPKRKGPIGRIVKRIGWCIVRKNICEINQSVNDVAEEFVNETFDENGTKLVEKLNNLTPTQLELMVEKYFPESKSDVLLLSTRSDSMLVGLGPPQSSFRDLPPAKSPIELWLKTRPLEALFIKSLVEWNGAHDLLRKVLPEDEAKKIAEDLSVETIDGWTVIRIGVAKESDPDNPEASE